jgi:hypothetical protein
MVTGCATYSDDLRRGQRMYLDTRYDQALATFRVLEPDLDSLSATQRTEYQFLRGMTDFRLGLRADARHWLALAKADNATNPGGLDSHAAAELEFVLAELNQEAYAALPGPDPVPSH